MGGTTGRSGGLHRLVIFLTVVLTAAAATALGVSAALAAVTTLYVATTGCSDSGSGTQSQPYCTIAKAATVATAGQTVLVSSGTYTGQVTVANSGTSSARIVFQAAPGASVTVTGGQYGFSLSSRQYVTIDGFRVTATTSYGINVSSSSNIVISDNTVTYAGQPVSGKIAYGISLKGVSSSLVTRNTTDRNSDSGIFLGSGTTSTTVSYNEASYNAKVYIRDANGIDVVSPGNSIIGNVTHDNEDSGIQFYTGADNNLAALNVSYNNGDHGIDDLNVKGGRIIGNTIFRNCTTGINVEGTSGNYVVENNIAVDNAVYPAYNGIACSRRAGNIGVWDSAPPTTTVDHNLVWLTRSGTLYVFGSKYTTLSAMQAATGQEQHGVQADPKFVSATGWNLQLQAGSPAIDRGNSGVSGAQSTDVLGKPRVDDPATPNTWAEGPRLYDDLGAYEYQPSAPAQAPTAALTVSPTSGTAPLAVTADASGSTDPQGQTLSYTFDFGDGTNPVGPQTTPTATHTYTTAGSYTAKVTVTNTSNLTATAQQTVTVSTASTTPPTYVSQIARNYSTSTKTSAYITVWRSAGVQAGDLVVLTLQLSATASSGTVAGTDSAGNSYTVARDVADTSGHRLVVLSGIAARALAVNDKITVTFPSSAGYNLVGDEYAGVTQVDRTAAAAGSGSSYSSGSTATTSSAAEVVVGAVAEYGASAGPTWAPGWKPATTYAVGTSYLGRAYQLPTATGTFAASGSGSGSWLAVTVTFR